MKHSKLVAASVGLALLTTASTTFAATKKTTAPAGAKSVMGGKIACIVDRVGEPHHVGVVGIANDERAAGSADVTGLGDQR